jgi:hypothetical protein
VPGVVVKLQLLVLVLHLCLLVGVNQVTAQGARKRQHECTFTFKRVIEAVIVLLSRLKRSNSPKTDQLNADRPSSSSPGPERLYLPVLLSLILIVLLLYVQPVSSTNCLKYSSAPCLTLRVARLP